MEADLSEEAQTYSASSQDAEAGGSPVWVRSEFCGNRDYLLRPCHQTTQRKTALQNVDLDLVGDLEDSAVV